MDIWRFLLGFLYLLLSVKADTHTVKVVTDQHVNIVDPKFLSFTLDPKYLFASNGRFNSKECVCMATSLTPAFLQIAGPTTSHMAFKNTTLLMSDVVTNQTSSEEKPSLIDMFQDRIHSKGYLKTNGLLKHMDEEVVQMDTEKNQSFQGSLAITFQQWNSFALWAKKTGFDLVFALNNNEKTDTGMWDPNTALNILTVAEKTNITDVFWQLGYECTNQSIEEYLNDLETLRVIMETFKPGQDGGWRVVGGDVSNCLHEESKSDFKDYVTLSTEMMDAVLLNGNSSSQELQRMSSTDRMRLLRLLSHSRTPLWLTEHTQRMSQLERAADWITSLGYSAKNGFAVHYRELLEEELYEPTLSFYMALLYKNLVGEKVLDVEMEASQSVVFAHCTSLRHQPVSGAVTLYGVNMDEESARFSVKLSKREEGGDIMQFILGHDNSGNIVVNGRPMYYEGDIKPVVKRVRPYKTLLINLPPKSFGFWVLANTKIEACKNIDDPQPVGDSNNNNEDIVKTTKTKRSLDLNLDLLDFPDYYDNSQEVIDVEDKDFRDKIDMLQNELNAIHKTFGKTKAIYNRRIKRQISNKEENNGLRRVKNRLKDLRRKTDSTIIDTPNFKTALFDRLFATNPRLNKRNNSVKRTKPGKRNSKIDNFMTINKGENCNKSQELSRKRRSIVTLSKDDKIMNDKDIVEISAENEISANSQEDLKLGKILRNIYKKLKDLPIDNDYEVTHQNIEEAEDNDILDETLMKSTFQKLISLLTELNKNLNRIWKSFAILE